MQCRRHGFNSWNGKILWRRTWQSTPVFLPGESHGHRSLAGYNPWGRTELDMMKRQHACTHVVITRCGFLLSPVSARPPSRYEPSISTLSPSLPYTIGRNPTWLWKDFPPASVCFTGSPEHILPLTLHSSCCHWNPLLPSTQLPMSLEAQWQGTVLLP